MHLEKTHATVNLVALSYLFHLIHTILGAVGLAAQHLWTGIIGACATLKGSVGSVAGSVASSFHWVCCYTLVITLVTCAVGHCWLTWGRDRVVWTTTPFKKGKWREPWVIPGTAQTSSHRSRRTATAMAAAGAAGAGAMVPAGVAPNVVGQFVLLARGAEYDEILICASVPQHAEHVGLTTTADGSSWAWVVVRLAAGNHVIPVASPAHVRVPPAGVPDHMVNWMCVPPAAHVKWTCGLAEFPGLMEEARQIAARVVQDGLAPGHIAAGQPAAALPTLMYPVTSMGAGAGLLPVGGNAGVVAGGVANPGAAGALGFNAQEPQTTPDELARLMEGIKLEIGRAKGETDKKAKKKKKKDKSKKSKKKKRGSSSSSSGRSRSGSSSSSASEDFLRWRQEGKTKRVKPEELRRLEAQRFKARGELLTFAAKHPGALSAYFLSMVHQKLLHGSVTKTSQLRKVNVSQWAAGSTGLTETRDLREVATLSYIMDMINVGDLETAMDVIAQRIMAIQKAKSAGSNWKKAEALELVVGNSFGLPGGMLRLTQ